MNATNFRLRAVLPGTWAVMLLFSSPVNADLRNRDAWRLLIPHEDVERMVPWAGGFAGTDDGGGLYFFDPGTQTIEALSTRDGLTSNRTTDVVVDDVGDLWVATADGHVCRVSPAFEVERITGLLSASVNAVAADGDLVYYGTDEGGGRIASGVPEFTFTEDDGMVSNVVTSLAAYDGLAWFGTEAGVSVFSRVANVFVTRNDGLSPVPPVINDILADELGVVCATEDGVFAYDDADSTWSPAGTGLTAEIVGLSRLGNDLVGITAGGGVHRLDQGSTAWMSVSLGAGEFTVRSAAETPSGDEWFGGSEIDNTRIGNQKTAGFWQLGMTDPVLQAGLHGTQPRGLALDGTGGVWAGTFPSRSGVTHWRSDGTVSAYNFLDDVDTDGWCDRNAMLAVLRASNGDIWVSSFGSCVTRMRPAPSDDPEDAQYDTFATDNSPLRSTKVVAMAEDPQGRIWFMSDGSGLDPLFDKGIDILLDPDAPYQATSWLKVDLDTTSLEGNDIRGLAFESGGVVWIGVNGVGIQRWDYDGFNDDGVISTQNSPAWWQVIDDATLEVDLSNPRGVVLASNGDLWVATNDQGAVRFAFDGFDATQVDVVEEASFGPTLLSNQVRGLVLDRDQHLWLATDSGLNRVRGTGPDLTIDTWTDFPAFEGRNLGQSYLPDIISPLPGSNVRRLAYDADRHRLFLATQTGGASLDIASVTVTVEESLEVLAYPNPLRGDGRFRISGFEGVVDVEIYNLTGVLIATSREVAERDVIWDARDINDGLVASGVYIARIIQGDSSVQITLAVER